MFVDIFLSGIYFSKGRCQIVCRFVYIFIVFLNSHSPHHTVLPPTSTVLPSIGYLFLSPCPWPMENKSIYVFNQLTPLMRFVRSVRLRAKTAKMCCCQSWLFVSRLRGLMIVSSGLLFRAVVLLPPTPLVGERGGVPRTQNLNPNAQPPGAQDLYCNGSLFLSPGMDQNVHLHTTPADKDFLPAQNQNFTCVSDKVCFALIIMTFAVD